MLLLGELRPVTGGLNPDAGDGVESLLASLLRWPGEPKVSSGDGSPPSAPGFGTRRGSLPPFAGRWQVPQATRLLLDSCSSQNSILPSTALAAVTGFSGGAGGAGSGPGPWAGKQVVRLPARTGPAALD